MAWCISRRRNVLAVLLFCFLGVYQIYGKKIVLVQLNEENWDQMLHGEWMVEFFAPWCPACRALQSTWEEFSTWSDDLGIRVGQIDVTANSGLSGRFMVTALPTIYHVKDGQFRQYRGSRDKEQLISFIEEKKWMPLEQVSRWKNPNSIQMSLVSYFFKLSMVLRSVHNHLVEQFKFPFWASILSFAVATIVIGAVLGLVLVCVVDYMYPVKRPAFPSSSATPASPPSPSQTTPADATDSVAESDEASQDDYEDSKPDGKSDTEELVRKRKVVDPIGKGDDN